MDLKQASPNSILKEIYGHSGPESGCDNGKFPRRGLGIPDQKMVWALPLGVPGCLEQQRSGGGDMQARPRWLCRLCRSCRFLHVV